MFFQLNLQTPGFSNKFCLNVEMSHLLSLGTLFFIVQSDYVNNDCYLNVQV